MGPVTARRVGNGVRAKAKKTRGGKQNRQNRKQLQFFKVIATKLDTIFVLQQNQQEPETTYSNLRPRRRTLATKKLSKR